MLARTSCSVNNDRHILHAVITMVNETGGRRIHKCKGFLQPLSLRSLQAIVSQAGKIAGIPDLTPHVLRHTFAKTLLDGGASLDKVAMLLGHSDLNTIRRYTTPSAEDLAQVVERAG